MFSFSSAYPAWLLFLLVLGFLLAYFPNLSALHAVMPERKGEGKWTGASSVPDPKSTISDPDPQIEHQEFRIRILDPDPSVN